MSPEEIAALRADYADTSRGQWTHEWTHRGHYVYSPGGPVAQVETGEDARFIVRTHRDIPRLLAEIERLVGLIRSLSALE